MTANFYPAGSTPVKIMVSAGQISCRYPATIVILVIVTMFWYTIIGFYFRVVIVIISIRRFFNHLSSWHHRDNG